MIPAYNLIVEIFKHMYPNNFDADAVHQILLKKKYGYYPLDVITSCWSSYVNERKRIANLPAELTLLRQMKQAA